ncbi:MAG: 4Fe-4S dicluster domain-containing protein [Nitrososphaerota archaeon]
MEGRALKILRRELLAGSVSALVGAVASSWASEISQPTELEVLRVGAEEKKWVFVVDTDRCNGCMKCIEACQEEMRVPPAWGEHHYNGRQPWIEVFDRDGYFLPVLCQNCQNAPCAKVCPVGATYYSEDHIVLIDQERCIGCRICITACPYQRRFFNWLDPPVREDEANIPYSPDYNIPHRRGVVEKCIWCRHRVVEGRLPACVEACTSAGHRALFFGDASEDVVSNGEEIVKLSKIVKGRAPYRLKEELGTEPRVIYLPPRGAGTT